MSRCEYDLRHGEYGKQSGETGRASGKESGIGDRWLERRPLHVNPLYTHLDPFFKVVQLKRNAALTRNVLAKRAILGPRIRAKNRLEMMLASIKMQSNQVGCIFAS